LAVLGISVLALWMARNPESKVLDLVAWAWAGFGSTFGPAVILSLYWQRMTRNAALAGMLVGGLTAVIWPLARGKAPIFDLYELLPGFALSTLAIVAVTLLRRK